MQRVVFGQKFLDWAVPYLPLGALLTLHGCCRLVDPGLLTCQLLCQYGNSDASMAWTQLRNDVSNRLASNFEGSLLSLCASSRYGQDIATMNNNGIFYCSWTTNMHREKHGQHQYVAAQQFSRQ